MCTKAAHLYTQEWFAIHCPDISDHAILKIQRHIRHTSQSQSRISHSTCHTVPYRFSWCVQCSVWIWNLWSPSLGTWNILGIFKRVKSVLFLKTVTDNYYLQSFEPSSTVCCTVHNGFDRWLQIIDLFDNFINSFVLFAADVRDNI